MDAHRYRQLDVALSLSLFVGYLTSRSPGTGTLVSGLAAFFGFLIFSSLVFFLVSSSSATYEAIATSLSRHTAVLFVPRLYARTIQRIVAVYLASNTPVLPFRFQLPPPTPSL